MTPHSLFDRSRLRLAPLEQRASDLDLSCIRPLERVPTTLRALEACGKAIRAAKSQGASSILMMGAHVLRRGMQRYLIDFLQRGLVSCIAVNGACAIHDFELALIGRTTESVAAYISTGQFGLWDELGMLNDIVTAAACSDSGIGSALGKAIAEGDFPHKDISIFAAAWEAGVPVTVHAGIGYDIVCEHPNYDGAAWGHGSYIDFLKFANQLNGLDGGIVMNFGSAVMAPEIFLKALAMARNVAHGESRSLKAFTTLVADLHKLPDTVTREAPKDSAAYYFRPWKTMLVRTVQDGGTGWYAQGDHAVTLPQLWSCATEGEPLC